jgi:hypothetical protein
VVQREAFPVEDSSLGLSPMDWPARKKGRFGVVAGEHCSDVKEGLFVTAPCQKKEMRVNALLKKTARGGWRVLSTPKSSKINKWKTFFSADKMKQEAHNRLSWDDARPFYICLWDKCFFTRLLEVRVILHAG